MKHYQRGCQTASKRLPANAAALRSRATEGEIGAESLPDAVVGIEWIPAICKESTYTLRLVFSFFFYDYIKDTPQHTYKGVVLHMFS
uniref:Uncharacterized protein n=1 Tax=Leersia perrieri TaxID=77586 RepID=A0A0D9Y0I8_9ORYZ